MSKASIKLQYNERAIWFYRHNNSDPEECLPLFKKFMRMVSKGSIRDNPEQSGGWLILLGCEEFNYLPDPDIGIEKQLLPNETDWKVGSIEPAPGKHDDIDYVYILDLRNRKIIIKLGDGEEIGVIDNFN